MFALRVRLGRRMEEIQEHVTERGHLGKHQLGRVCRTLSRCLQRQLPEPFRERFAALVGSRLDRSKLLWGYSCRDRFRACLSHLLTHLSLSFQHRYGEEVHPVWSQGAVVLYSSPSSPTPLRCSYFG